MAKSLYRSKMEGDGRSRKGPAELDKQIMDFMERNGGTATWPELKINSEGKPRNESSLKKALDRLKKDGVIVTIPVIGNGRPFSLYALKTRQPFMKQGDTSVSFYEWIEKTTELLKTDAQKRIEVQKIIKSGGWPGPETQVYCQEGPLKTAAKWLGVIILTIIEEYNAITDEKTRADYLTRISGSYLNNLIAEAARLASPSLGDSHAAIAAAIDQMGEEDLIFQLIPQLPLVIDTDKPTEGNFPKLSDRFLTPKHT